MTGVTDLLEELEWRGLIAQSTDRDALSAALSAGQVTLYSGFDPTAPSLHVGNLVPLLTLRRFQLAGHRPLGLVGGATGLIGDPSGRSSERVLNTADTVGEWVERIRGQLERFLDFDPTLPNAAKVVNNLDWTQDVSAIELLRDVGKHFSVNQMLTKESVSARLNGEGISFTEFSYMILQSFDYAELFRREDCTLQIGGSDQWGNITAGLDLIRRLAAAEGRDAPDAHALTVPLITKADGTKFGKTAGGSVWLDPELTSPYAFFQFWLNTDDRDVMRFVRTFGFGSREEVEALDAATQERPQAREAQRALARELTTLVHGAEETERVEAASAALFGRGSLAELDERTLAAALREAGATTLEAGPTPTVVELLVASGLCESKGAARRAVGEGGAYVNNERVSDDAHVPSDDDFLHGRWLVLRRGRRTFAGVERS
jgi:tyrosyl-tRNA synthetase